MRAWMVLVLSLVGCGDVEQAWDEWVDEHNSCEVAADCALVFPGCPLGCATAVNVEFVDDAEAKASRLIGRYERFGRSYDDTWRPLPTIPTTTRVRWTSVSSPWAGSCFSC